jgi:hypothetical protein
MPFAESQETEERVSAKRKLVIPADERSETGGNLLSARSTGTASREPDSLSLSLFKMTSDVVLRGKTKETSTCQN